MMYHALENIPNRHKLIDLNIILSDKQSNIRDLYTSSVWPKSHRKVYLKVKRNQNQKVS